MHKIMDLSLSSFVFIFLFAGRERYPFAVVRNDFPMADYHEFFVVIGLIA